MFDKENRKKTYRVETPVSVASVKGTEFSSFHDAVSGVDKFVGKSGNFEVFKPSFVDIKIKNISGREIQNIYSGYLYAGKHEKVWYASDFPSGLYLISLVLDKQIINTSKVSLIK